MRHHHGAGGTEEAHDDDDGDGQPDGRVRKQRQGREQANDHQRAADRDPLAGVEPAVERAEGEHADLIGDHGAEQDIAGGDRAQPMDLAQERAAPQALHGEGAGIVAEIQREDRLQARVAQHLDQAPEHLA